MSKWSIANDMASTHPQPRPKSVQSSTAAVGDDTSQTPLGIGRHCQNASARAADATSTYVERSRCAGTRAVQRRLNAGRAITLCWTAKTPSSSASMIAAAVVPERGPPWSTVRGTTVSARKATPYRKAPTKAR